MKEEMMTTGFTGGDAATGPTAGFDPVMKFRKKLKKKKVQKESLQENCPRDGQMVRPLFQYKVSMPEIGETILFANSPAELTQKLRLLFNPRQRAQISVERIMPMQAAKFYQGKKDKALRNVAENADKQMQAQMTQQQIANEKKKVQMKIKELQTQLQKKTANLKQKARVGGAKATVDK